MQKKNREIHIFSLSALDLFCSAMGAMIVLSIVLMPSYRKNTTVEDLEVVFVIDATGSMGEQLQDLKENISSTVTALQRMSRKLRVGVVVYRDHGYDGTMSTYTLTAQERFRFPKLGGNSGVIRTRLAATQIFPILEIPGTSSAESNPNLDRLQKFIDQVWPVHTDKNTDTPEAVLSGFQAAVGRKMNWESESSAKKLVILIGDAPTHKKEWPELASSAQSWRAAGANRHISTVYTAARSFQDRILANDSTYQEGKIQFQTIANEGQFRENAGELMGSILDAVVVANQ